MALEMALDLKHSRVGRRESNYVYTQLSVRMGSSEGSSQRGETRCKFCRRRDDLPRRERVGWPGSAALDKGVPHSTTR